MVSALIETLTMRPQPAASIGGTAARAIRNGPTILVSITMRQTSGAASQNRVGSVMNCSLTYFMRRPALLTRTSRRPKRSSAAATIRSQSSSLVTSATRGTTRPFGTASAATRSTSSRSRAAVAMTVAPARASPWVIARPNPLPPPVTMATRPSSDGSSLISAPLFFFSAL